MQAYSVTHNSYDKVGCSRICFGWLTF